MCSLRISVLASGGGSNFQAVIDGIKSGYLENMEIVQLISSSHKAYALTRAKENNIPSQVISSLEYTDMDQRMEAVKTALDSVKPDLVVLAGYLSVLPEGVIEGYRGKIINIHPSLLPLHGGKGCYGIKVHQQVIQAGEKESGATVHYVDKGIDTGTIILQEKVAVLEGDTAETLAARVLEVEHQILPKAIALIGKERG